MTVGLGRGPVPSFRAQACGLGGDLLDLVRRGYFAPRNGELLVLPQTPAYQASGAGGWTHSGPWPYLTRVPLVFYGPGIVPAIGGVDDPATLADVAPTLGRVLGHPFATDDGRALPAVAARRESRPRLVVVVVWDGGGWNTLRQWPEAWPNLRRMMHAGVSFTDASVGSSPSVTPATHTTLGTGHFPWVHGITAIPVRDERGEIVDSFLGGESARFLRVRAFAERWDESSGGRALVGMVGYEPWHLGMIGQGAERSGGDRDDAVWLDPETNEWTTNREHYSLPPSIPATPGLVEDVTRTDAADGEVDGAWRDNAIIRDRTRLEELPGFVHYHERVLENLVSAEGYGADRVADLLFTNFKQIDRNGHYYGMDAPEVRDSLVASDDALGRLLRFLERVVGRYLVVVTADHGMQPDASQIDAYGIDPNQVEADVNAEFGPVLTALWPTEAFLDREAMEARGVTDVDVARFLSDYRLRDNAEPDVAATGAGPFGPGDRLYALAIPARLLDTIDCTQR